MLTTHQKIRVDSGFQSRFTHEPFTNDPDGSETRFFVNTDDYVKFVPEFATGNTVAGISDVKVFTGNSGIPGISQMVVTGIDIELGTVTLDTAPDTGVSLTVTYSSSSIPNEEVEDVRKRAEAIVNQKLSQCYELPIDPVPSSIERLATELAAALLLIRYHGTGSRDTAADGYEKYEMLMGSPANNDSREVGDSGEIGLICTPNYHLVDDDGVTIPRTDTSTSSFSSFKVGGRVNGRIYDITEERFRRKPFQEDVNIDQAGSGNPE